MKDDKDPKDEKKDESSKPETDSPADATSEGEPPPTDPGDMNSPGRGGG